MVHQNILRRKATKKQPIKGSHSTEQQSTSSKIKRKSENTLSVSTSKSNAFKFSNHSDSHKSTSVKKKHKKSTNPAKIRKQNVDPRQKTAHKNKKKRKEKEISKEEELTQRKKIHLEYFIYKNSYLPIENTEQRRFVFKLNLIDERITTASHKNVSNQQTSTDSIMMLDKAVSCVKSKEGDNRENAECQTEQEIKNSYLSQAQGEERSFAQTLSELEFMYLPDARNFEGFSKIEKNHYRQLFYFIAKKFECPEEQLDENAVDLIISERQYKQRGLIQSYPRQGIPTHTPSILSYLSNLFCYLELHQKFHLIDRINITFGFPLAERYSKVRRGLDTGSNTKLLPESIFWVFEDQLHGDLTFESSIVEQSLHYHNKAIFDCVNEVLQTFQPYYFSNGEPFPWSYNFETTFYCITEDSFPALVSQVKQKIWQYSSVLSGLIIDTGTDHRYKAHVQRILQNEKSMLMKEMKKCSDRVGHEEELTQVMTQISDLIQQQLISQLSFML